MPQGNWTLPRRHPAFMTFPALRPSSHLPLWALPAVWLVGASLLLNAGVAQAAPANDDIARATVITALPFTDALDTTEATTAPDDPDCVGNGPTVWYAFTPAVDTFVLANTFGSDYDTTLSVYAVEAGALTQISCNDDFDGFQSALLFEATAGVTYYFMAGSCCGNPGGSLHFSIDVTPPPLVFDLALSGKGSVTPKTGVATIRGTVVCSVPGFVHELYGTVQQRKGRALFTATFAADGFECAPPQTAWSAAASSPNGLFTGGKATLSDVYSFACNEVSCHEVIIAGPITIQLTGKKK